MTTARDGFQEVQLSMIELIDALNDIAAYKEAAKAYTRAQRQIKKHLPAVMTPTRFLVGEDWAVEVTPEGRDGFVVKDMVVQKKQIRQLK